MLWPSLSTILLLSVSLEMCLSGDGPLTAKPEYPSQVSQAPGRKAGPGSLFDAGHVDGTDDVQKSPRTWKINKTFLSTNVLKAD